MIFRNPEDIMKRLLSYMKHYKKESILGPLFKMLEASFELFVPLVVAAWWTWASTTGMWAM